MRDLSHLLYLTFFNFCLLARTMSASGLNEADQKELQTFLDGQQAKARVQASTQTFTDVRKTRQVQPVE